MNLQQILLLMQTDMHKMMQYCEACTPVKNVYDNIKYIDPLLQYHPETHAITDIAKRPDKILYDEAGNMSGVAIPARIAIPVQKNIVTTAAAMLGNPALEANADQDFEIAMLDAIKYIWTANMLDYSFLEILETTMSEKACAELWYTKDVDEAYAEGYALDSNLRLSMKILSRSRGDSLYPVFDEFDNMIAFGRGYKVLNEDAVLIQHFDVYTADKVYSSKYETNVWLWGVPGEGGISYQSDFIGYPNPIGKIPVIYYWKPRTEWQDVQTSIERKELMVSNLADTNDYSGSPILVGKGKVLGMSKKGEQGKYVELDNGAELDYLTYDSAPESQKLEMEKTDENINTGTHTPDMSFEKLMGLGYFSQVALRTLLSHAHFKAAKNEAIFAPCVKRRINFLKKAISVLDKKYVAGLALDIKPKFTYYLPANFTEEIDRVVTAVDSGIMSKETGVNQNPLVTDPVSELQRIKDEAAEAAKNVPTPVVPIAKPVIEKAPSTAQANN